MKEGQSRGGEKWIMPTPEVPRMEGCTDKYAVLMIMVLK